MWIDSGLPSARFCALHRVVAVTLVKMSPALRLRKIARVYRSAYVSLLQPLPLRAIITSVHVGSRLRWCVNGLGAGLLLLTFNASAATAAQIQAAQVKGVAWLLSHQTGNGNWAGASGSEIVASSAALAALRRAGVKGYPNTKAILWLDNTQALSTDALGRQISELAIAGIDVSSLTNRLLAIQNGAGVWGAYDHYAGSFPDTSLAVTALSALNQPVTTGITFIINNQNGTDGGWPYSPTEPSTMSAQSHVVPTAYNILALNQNKANFPQVQSNLTSAIAWLKTQQKAGGGFGEGSTGTVLETALASQAIFAALAANDVAAAAGQDFLIAQQGADGSWNGDAFTTAVALQTFPVTTYSDTDGDGIPDAVEILLGSNPYIADSRWLAGQGNGQAISGVHVPTALSSAVVNTAYSFSLSGSGTAPYTWVLTTGTLPPGLALSNGVISGTPTVLGSYSFSYTVTDTNGVVTPVVGQIDITAAGDGDINGDGVVDIADVALAKRIALGLIVPTATQLAHGDVSGGDGVIDVRDVARIRRKALGLENF